MTTAPPPTASRRVELVAFLALSRIEPGSAAEEAETTALPEGCAGRPFTLPCGRPALSVEAADPAPAAMMGNVGGRLPAGADLRRAVAHKALVRQKRLEALAPLGTVVPAAPGTLPPDDLSTFARANAPALAAAVERLCGRAQFQVVVAWDARRAARRFAAAPELSGLPRRPPRGARAAAVAALARRLGDEIASRLAATATDAIRLPDTEGGLANLVLLVDHAERVALEATLEEVDALWKEGLRIRLVGPSPALSFARAQLETVGTDDLADAARRLGADPGLPVAPAAVAGLRRRALTATGGPDALLPAEIDRAATLLAACARLGRAPAAPGEAVLLSLARDGLPMAAGRAATAGPIAEVA
ncbi:hypothetical protein DLJ49_08790 [Rhodovulum sp. 12E13]|uniref:GvpL/GvpF family gas vesicle protein n=1 Tax=Rhodovulum sp. 12E13 TaxID=2203891 RepID=UPI000E16B667|nr:GvpL/GvpF family gas vesicle protein [Rhodovulum sp. 12E13]RDC73192.1 hypothetical protein DLJ49_08790 [Rhodovulum sp. 12E13]